MKQIFYNKWTLARTFLISFQPKFYYMCYKVATVTKYLTSTVVNERTLLEYITNTSNVPVFNATMILGLMGYF